MEIAYTFFEIIMLCFSLTTGSLQPATIDVISGGEKVLMFVYDGTADKGTITGQGGKPMTVIRTGDHVYSLALDSKKTVTIRLAPYMKQLGAWKIEGKTVIRDSEGSTLHLMSGMAGYYVSSPGKNLVITIPQGDAGQCVIPVKKK